MALSAKDQAQVALIEEIYQNFRQQMTRLQQRQNKTINAIIKRVDHTKTEEILQQLKKS
ncbi:MAG: hypothetical protein ACD_41C00296G0001 [uncultured bacterium]|nr:MAG: hypothetical protein ACD_41C00296G0001 [uncultured bacterium]